MSAPEGMRVAVLGSGSWGTTFAQVIADAGAQVRLWGRRADVAESVTTHHVNGVHLAGVRLPDAVTGTTDLAHACAGADLVVLAVPVQQLRSVLTWAGRELPVSAPRVSLLKGLEAGTHLRVSEVVTELAGPAPVAVLSGPNLAREIAERRPCATLVASTDHSVAVRVAAACTTDYFRPFTSTDVVGVEIAGATKNLLAVAVGLADGLGLGDNAKASVIALGLAETTRLVTAMGGAAATVSGLAGAGDAFATCASSLSRNHRLGVGLSEGLPLAQVLAGLGGTAEAVETSRSISELAAGAGVAMPLVEQVTAVLHHGRHPHEAATHLLSRAPGREGG